MKCVIWPEVFTRFEKIIQSDTAVLVSGKLEITDDGHSTLIAEEVARLDDVLQRKSKAVLLRLPAQPQPNALLEGLFGLMDKHKGDCEVLIEFALEGNVLVRARPHGAMRVQGSLELENAFRQHGCQVE